MDMAVGNTAKQSKAETIIFQGIPFRRYPQSPHAGHRKYYSPSGRYIKRGIGNLHVEIWKFFHGPIPDGHHIHHIDGDPLNNDISNLACLSAEEHYAIHIQDGRVRAAIAWAAKKDKVLAAAANWHGSEEGRAWHREHAKKQWKEREPTERICEQCGNVYLTKKASSTRFCSNKCKSKWRRNAGLDNVEKLCEKCGQPFISNKYDKVRFCSRLCARHSRWWRND